MTRLGVFAISHQGLATSRFYQSFFMSFYLGTYLIIYVLKYPNAEILRK